MRCFLGDSQNLASHFSVIIIEFDLFFVFAYQDRPDGDALTMQEEIFSEC